MIGGCLFPANRSDRAFEHDGRADRARALMQGGDLLLDLSFFDGRSIALAQEIEPGRADVAFAPDPGIARSEGHTSELQSLMRISSAVTCLKNKHIIEILLLHK